MSYKEIFQDRQTNIIFLFSFTILLSLWGLGVHLNDESGIVILMVNILNGSLTIKEIPNYLQPWMYGWIRGVLYTVNGATYTNATHAVPVFAIPFYFLLKLINSIIDVRIFFSVLWSVCIFLLIYFIKKQKIISAFISILLLITNLLLAKPLSFEIFGELISIQFLDIVLTSCTITIAYKLFYRIFNNKPIGIFASLFILLATPITYWGVAAKDHALSVFLIVLALYLFYKYTQTQKLQFRYIAYTSIGLSVWVRIFDGIAFFLAMFLIDIITNKKNRLKSIAIILLFTLIGLIPFFVNNYLLFGNPIYPSGYVWGHRDVIVSTTTQLTFPINAVTTMSIILATQTNIPNSNIALIFNSLKDIPEFFKSWWSMKRLRNLPENLFNYFFYSGDDITLAIFQISPLLVLSLIAIFKRKYLNNPISALFALHILMQIIFYGTYSPSDEVCRDMRYFLPIYIGLLYFTIALLKDIILKNLNLIYESYTGLLLIFTPATVYSMYTLRLRGLNDLFVPNRIFGVICTVTLIIVYVYFAITKKPKLEKVISALIAFSMFLASFWIISTTIVMNKGFAYINKSDMMIPLMYKLHIILAKILLFGG